MAEQKRERNHPARSAFGENKNNVELSMTMPLFFNWNEFESDAKLHKMSVFKIETGKIKTTTLFTFFLLVSALNWRGSPLFFSTLNKLPTRHFVCCVRTYTSSKSIGGPLFYTVHTMAIWCGTAVNSTSSGAAGAVAVAVAAVGRCVHLGFNCN